MFKKMRGMIKSQEGFTLIELVVAIGIMLILAAVATPFLLAHIKDAKVANVNEQVLNVKAGFDSYFTKNGGLIADSDADGNYLDEMITDGWMSSDPTGKNSLNWAVEKYTDGSNNSSFFIHIVNAAAGDGGYTYLADIVSDLDEIIDGADDGSAGRLQYAASDTDTDGTDDTVDIYYLLHAAPGMTTWH